MSTVRVVFVAAATGLTAALFPPVAAADPEFVGSWLVWESPAEDWTCCPPNGPLAYTGQEAAALLFGGNPEDYVISTAGEDVAAINYMAWYDVIGWGGREFPQDHDVKYLGEFYGPTSGYGGPVDEVAASALVYDNSPSQRNYAFRVMFEYDTTSFVVLADDSALAMTEQQFALGRVMASGEVAEAGKNVFHVSAAGQNTAANPTTAGARTSSVAALSFGHGISDTVTLGATVSLSGTSLRDNAFDMNAGFGAAIWGQYSEGGTARTGLQFGAALGYMRATGEIDRGRTEISDELPTGSARVETRAVRAELGYGIEQGGFLVTPSIGLARLDTRRAAYTETGAAGVVNYDEMRVRRTVATLAVATEFAVGEQGHVTLDLGLEREFNSTAARLTGTSDLPGLSTFDIESDIAPNRTRPFAAAGYTHDMGNGASVSGNVRVGRAVYGSKPSLGFGASYTMRF